MLYHLKVFIIFKVAYPMGYANQLVYPEKILLNGHHYSFTFTDKSN